MARKNNKQKDLEEHLQDEDFSSSDVQIHNPNENDANLECEEEAYEILEYLDLPWPAQSITLNNNKIYCGTNPSQEQDNNISECEMVEIKIKSAECNDCVFKSKATGQFINRIRVNKMIFAISDFDLALYDNNLKQIKSIKGEFGYGLYVDEEKVYAGKSDGTLQIYDHNLALIKEFKVHNKPIDTICCKNNIIYTGSQDKTLKFTDMNGNNIKTINHRSDINSLDVNSSKLIFGDDDGLLKLIDLNTEIEEEIKWHKTPISTIKWKDEEVFASGSDEQLCIWDITLDEEWDYHKYLLFVHQGQNFYKDCLFYEDKIITTSQDGICIFKPISFGAELPIEDE